MRYPPITKAQLLTCLTPAYANENVFVRLPSGDIAPVISVERVVPLPPDNIHDGIVYTVLRT